ncbi:MAG: nucleotidyltransferase domain-containing protein [Nanoarchaeota archaeon]
MKKEENVLELFFNEPTKHWHFEEILKEAKISRPQAVQWLNKMRQEGIVQRIKKRAKMPYYISYFNNPPYKSRKRVYAIEQLWKSGFLSHVLSLKNTKIVTIFGSFVTSDWYSQSDIDLFIYGDASAFDQSYYRKKLHRQIQLFVCKTQEDIKKIPKPLLLNMMKGYTIKGTGTEIKEVLNG